MWHLLSRLLVSWLKKGGFCEQRAPGRTSERPHQSVRGAAGEPGDYTHVLSHQSLATRTIFSSNWAQLWLDRWQIEAIDPGVSLNCNFSQNHSNQTVLFGLLLLKSGSSWSSLWQSWKGAIIGRLHHHCSKHHPDADDRTKWHRHQMEKEKNLFFFKN